MKETITPEMIEAVQDAVKNGEYDFEKLTINIFGGSISPCSVTQGLFPEILDMALELYKRKASISLTEWISGPDQKTSNIEYKNKQFKLINNVLPKYDWSLVAK